MSTASIRSANSPLLRSTLALHSVIAITSVLAAAAYVNLSQLGIVGLLTLLIVFVLTSGWVLQRRFSTSIEVDRRLNELASCHSIGPDILHPLRELDQAATGWNRLVESVCVQRLLDTAEASMVTGSSSEDPMITHVLDTLTDGLIVTDSEGLRIWQNASVDSILPSDHSSDGQPGLLQLHELFRCFHNFDKQLPLLTDRTTLAPLTFEMQRGECVADGVIRVFRQCLFESETTFLWSVRDVTQQKLALEMRDTFVSAATHELRTPLSNIRAYAETLIAADKINPEEERQFLNVILAEAGRLERTIENLLNISHMQAGGMTLDRHETQIDRLVSEVQETIRPLFEKKTLEFEAIVPPRLPELNVDKNKLEAALVNLLGNAIKYTPAGGHVRLEAEHEGNEIRFHVEDTGIGIAEVEIPKLFERFFRSSDPRVNDIEGTGLGLAFAQDVARLHGGRIEVASELNKGSRFSLILPSSLAKLTPG